MSGALDCDYARLSTYLASRYPVTFSSVHIACAENVVEVKNSRSMESGAVRRAIRLKIFIFGLSRTPTALVLV